MNKEIVPQYLTLAELAIYASVSKNTMKKWLKSGLPYYRVGRSIRVKVDEFNEWMNHFRVCASKNLDVLWNEVMKEVEVQCPKKRRFVQNP